MMTNSISLNLCTSSTNSHEKHAEITNVVAKPIYNQVIDIVKSIVHYIVHCIL